MNTQFPLVLACLALLAGSGCTSKKTKAREMVTKEWRGTARCSIEDAVKYDVNSELNQPGFGVAITVNDRKKSCYTDVLKPWFKVVEECQTEFTTDGTRIYGSRKNCSVMTGRVLEPAKYDRPPSRGAESPLSIIFPCGTNEFVEIVSTTTEGRNVKVTYAYDVRIDESIAKAAAECGFRTPNAGRNEATLRYKIDDDGAWVQQ